MVCNPVLASPGSPCIFVSQKGIFKLFYAHFQQLTLLLIFRSMCVSTIITFAVYLPQGYNKTITTELFIDYYGVYSPNNQSVYL